MPSKYRSVQAFVLLINNFSILTATKGAITDRLIAQYVEFSLDRKIEHFAFGKHTVVCLFV